jgi:hypothetical protein
MRRGQPGKDSPKRGLRQPRFLWSGLARTIRGVCWVKTAMTGTTRVAVGIIGTGVALGIWADVLFYGRSFGLNVLLWTMAFVGALAVLLRVARAPLHQGRRWMLAPLLVFSAAFVWHDSQLLIAANLIALAGALTLGALRRNGRPMRLAPVTEYVAGAAVAGFSALAGAVHLLHADVQWGDLRRSVRDDRVTTVGRGIVLGMPLILLFGGLFMAADAVFRSFVTAAIPTFDDAGQQAVFVGVAAWLAAGLLRDLLARREEDRLLSPAALTSRRVPFSVRPAEVAVALGALNLLFLAFVVVQFRYLFGGEALVQARAQLTYAEYARHGFFELLAVAGLVLLVLLAIDALITRGRGARLVRVLSAGLVALVFVVIASALQRMYLYQEAYGLTELRIYVVGVILWLAAVFVWFALTVLRGRRRGFAAGAVIAGFVATAVLNVVDPDALIVRTNLERPRVDVAYLAGLNDDAVPALLERLPGLPPDLRRALAAELLTRADREDDWRSFNLARARASALLAQHHGELVAYSRQGG